MIRSIWILTAWLIIPGIALAGPTEAVRKSEFEKALSVILATATPQISAASRKKRIEDYVNAKPNKGQAIEPATGNTWRSSVHDDEETAGEDTLEGCQLRYEKPCVLIAVNEKIVADGELLPKDMPRLHYAGEFDLAQIPIIRSVTRDRFGVQHYYGTNEPKAMALAASGRIYISRGTASLMEAERDALKQCNWDPARDASEGSCFLYASNNNVVLSQRLISARVADFEKALNVILATAVPRMSVALRESTVRDYGKAQASKGQAIELISASPWRSTGHEDQSAAGDRTLEGCQLHHGKPCALIAVNEEIVAKVQLTPKDMPRLHYSGEFDLAKIPIIRLTTRLDPAVQNYLGTAAPKAMPIHPWGKLFISQGKKSLRDAEDAALANCNDDPERKGMNGNCFLYAIDNDVVISKRLQISPSDH